MAKKWFQRAEPKSEELTTEAGLPETAESPAEITTAPTGSESGDSLADAAARVSPLPEEVPSPETPEDETGLPAEEETGKEEVYEQVSLSWWGRFRVWILSKVALSDKERALVKAKVSDETALYYVNAPFAFLAEVDHPAWALTQEEAQGAAPEMAAALEKVLDRYVPESLAYLKAKNPEAFSLVVVMTKLTLKKTMQVGKAKVAAVRAGNVDTGQDAA